MISLDGHTISYVVKRSARAKYVRLEVRGETGLIVVIPKPYKLGQLPELLRQKRRWIMEKLAKFGHIPMLSLEKQLRSGDTIPYLGRDLVIVRQQNHAGRDSARLDWERLVVSLRLGNSRLDLLLEQWYRIQATRLLVKRTDELSARIGVNYNRIVIRGQKTRWGSCSGKGNLSFNWKLMTAPEPVIDYVIIHELAHLKEMNHSESFWELVSEHCPRWRDHKKWLKDHEAQLATKFSPRKQPHFAKA